MPMELPKSFKGHLRERREAILAIVFLGFMAALTTLAPRTPELTPDQIRQRLLIDIERTR